jgi:hypothetical protein
MIKSLLLATALLVLTISTSFAQRGSLTLGWNNCRLHGGGVENMTFACNTNSGAGPLLVGGFIPSATANLNSLNSAFVYLDIYTQFVPMPAWWTFTDPPVTGCRPLNVWGLDMENAAGAVCDRSYWSEVSPPSSATRWFFPTYQGNHGALRMLVAVDAQAATQTPQIGTGEESHIFGVRLGRANTTGPGACAGCDVPMSLHFTEADFFQTNLDNFVIGGFGSPYSYPGRGSNCATWQMLPNDRACSIEPLPTNNSSWGAIKSLYR